MQGFDLDLLGEPTEPTVAPQLGPAWTPSGDCVAVYMAHELVQPLHALSSCIALLEYQKDANETARGLLARCRDLVGRMGDVVNDLRALSGADRMEPDSVAVATLI